MVKVAVTGGIGSGKSYVCRLLEKRGFSVFYCDDVAKRIVATSSEIQAKLKNTVGGHLFVDGKLQKAVMAEYMMCSETNVEKINNIIHPAVTDEFTRSGHVWMECAILFSSGFNRLVDKVVCVTAPLEVRLGRIMGRDGISEVKAMEWINMQMPQDEILALSDFEIVNDGVRNLDTQIDRILEALGMPGPEK